MIMSFLSSLILGAFLVAQEDQQKDLIPIEPPQFRIYKKKDRAIPPVAYGYRAHTTDWTSSFSGEAYYKLPLEKKRSDRFFTAGARLENSSVKLRGFEDAGSNQAMAQLGFNREIVMPNRKEIFRVEVAQPVFVTNKDFIPSVVIGYDLNF
jgi:hypothetical protein